MLTDTLSTTDLWVTGVVTALALSADSLCASATDAVEFSHRRHKIILILAISGIFALFHFFMPIIGFSIGSAIINLIEGYIHYISFAILLFLGLKGLLETIMDLHVKRMDALAEKAEYRLLPRVEEKLKEGMTLPQIRKELKEYGHRLMSGDPEAIARVGLKDPKKCHELGIFLKHSSKWLTAKKLKQLENPETEEQKERKATIKILLTVTIQAFATSLDALLVGFNYSGMGYGVALPLFAMFFGVVFLMCAAGGFLGKFFGEKSETWANVIGSLVLIGIGIKALF